MELNKTSVICTSIAGNFVLLNLIAIFILKVHLFQGPEVGKEVREDRKKILKKDAFPLTMFGNLMKLFKITYPLKTQIF